MAFNRDTWKNWTAGKPCPACDTGILQILNKNTVIKTEIGSSKEMNAYGNGNTYSDFIFSIHLECSHCKDVVAVLGDLYVEHFPFKEEFTPKMYLPAPKIIHIPKSCPESIRKVLNETFSLFWVDLSSCANKIRIAIEVLLNEQGVNQKKTTKNREKDISLGERLVMYKKTNSDIAEPLIAIKWIGNAGSHFAYVTVDDVLDAFELLEYSLEKLYNDRENSLVELSGEINKNRKPKSSLNRG